MIGSESMVAVIRRLNLWLYFRFVPPATVLQRNLIRTGKAMASAALRKQPALKTFHATMLVTRTEEWCVEAETAEEARRLLAAGDGHRSVLETTCTSKCMTWTTESLLAMACWINGHSPTRAAALSPPPG
jgi:hypothetical protein